TKLLEKCAGLMLTTRINSSRISCGSCSSSTYVSLCRSAGEWIVGNSLLITRPLLVRQGLLDVLRSAGPFNNEVGQACQVAPKNAQRLDRDTGLRTQITGTRAALARSQHAGVCQLTAIRIFLHVLSSQVGLSFDVQKVVGDLESLAKTAPIFVEAGQYARIWSARILALNGPDPQPQTGAK